MNQVLNVRMVNNDVLGSVDDAAGTPTVIGLLKQTYNKLNSSTGNTSLNLTLLQNKVTALENSVNGSEITNPPIEGLTARVSDLEDVTDDQSDAIRRNGDNISDLSTSVTNLSTSINTINGNITTINGDLTTLTNRITAVDKIDSAITNPNHGRLKIVEDEINTLDTTVQNLVDEIEGTDGVLDDITNIQADIGILQSTVNGFHSGVGESTNNLGGERFNLYSNGNPVRNEASGDYSHAEGYLTIASGDYSHVEGASNTSSGEASHAEGEETIASGTASHAEGYKTVASGNYAHAEGYTNNPTSYFASGQGSHTEGFDTKATNTACHAEGYCTSATGLYAHAEGYYTIAHGYYSHAEGRYTRARGQNMTAMGQFNTIDSNDSITNANRLLVVGNGINDTNRSDAFVVKTSGAVIINSTGSGTTPSLQIGTSKAITGTTAASSSQAFEDDILVTKYYANNDLMAFWMNIAYPIDSIYFSHNNIGLYDDQGNLSSTGKPLTPTRSPLDFGTWYQINWDCDNYYQVGLLPKNGAGQGTMRGDKKLSIRHLPAHAHIGIWTPDGARPSGSGGTACVPANTASGNNPRWNETAVIPNSLGDSPDGASYTNYGPSSMQGPLQPYGYYCYMYRKVSLN